MSQPFELPPDQRGAEVLDWLRAHPLAIPPEWLRVYEFGVFVIPLPEPLRTQVAALRGRFDPTSAAIAPPHITLTTPLAQDPNDIARADLGAALADALAPFEVEIGPARRFPGTPVVYLAVAPPDPIRHLRSTAHATGLFRLDGPHVDDFTPHITIREFPVDPTVDDADAIQTEGDRLVGRGTFTVKAGELWRPDAQAWFSAVDRIELTGP